MVRRGRGTKRAQARRHDYSCSQGTTTIRGTSTRPLISYQANQPAVILADVAEPIISEPEPSQQASIVNEDEKSDEVEPKSEMEDDRLYCICRTLYDGRTMIACDRCDNWYHNDCVGIEEDSVELVDIFICPSCQTGDDKQTTWKKKCARPSCNLAARVLSKYCSDWCGTEQAANRISNATTEYHRLWDSVRTANKPEGIVIIECQESIEPTSSSIQVNGNLLDDILLSQHTNRLEELLSKKVAVESQIQLAISRSKYLSYTISRWENMCLATARALQIQEAPNNTDQSTPATTTTTKPKRGGGGRGRGRGRGGAKKSETSFLSSATSSAEAPCGFDVRLIWDDKDWAQWTSTESFAVLFKPQESENHEPIQENPDVEKGESNSEPTATIDDHGIEEGVICLIMRKKCDRHLGWQKTRENDFETELNTLNMVLDKLSSQIQSLKDEIQERKELWKFRMEKQISNRSQPPHGK
ncbi:hypothetical protein KEM48_000295 [Puccinia striiformis f. sp. tritici PST-130]|nr:hypothetical protein KEM48_000295 [Puccinia striiformis f. sp. tritici PST-130]